ncbi:cell division ATP-binding protein FtsE [Collinsella sp. An7]|uniref:cell division ATP-binding protein FtsE n=1 Tax=Collinsella sp. An7 TaxID=1965651 RepID=UPI000B366472|nr:cell division ATP-binding protein FtsE [Collinsella sp. An7]OUN48310.1 cell division ATP-binding protein FtsE [Collinsella sp. An7]
MANHFRKPEDGQDEVSTPSAEPVVASHFALSTDADAAQSQDTADAAPAAAPAPGDTGAFLASAGVASAAPAPAAVPDPFAAPAPAAPQVAELAAIPEVTAEPEVTADQADEVADLNAALADPNFTTVFAPVTESRQKKARDAGVEPVILFEHVTKVYPAQPNKPALDDVNIEIYPGEFVFLVGHSGSGKSTMLRTMTRDVKPTSGRVLVAGQDLMRIKNRKVPFFRRQIGTVFQDFKLLPGKTVYENVAFVLQCIGKPRGVIRTQVPEVLRLVGLADQMDSMPDQLSGGEQQRVSVARAMVNRPPLLICDEPTGNLDPAISLGIMKLLERINRTGTTVIVATHDREMVDSMRRRVISLEAGHVVRDQERGGYGNYGA